jgi:FkbM family methyltransferase
VSAKGERLNVLEIARGYVPQSLKDVLQSWRSARQPYEPELARALRRTVQPGWVCADVGANVGVITTWLARLVGPAGEVVAFEAHPGNARLLRAKINRSGLQQRVRIEQLAVSDGSGNHLWLYAGRHKRPAEWNIMGCDVDGIPTQPEIEIAATSLDAYFPPGTRLDLVKVDVEGAEALVLVGMRRLLRDTRPIVFLEFHNDVGWAGRAELFAAGYCLYDTHGMQIRQENSQRVYHCIAVPQESRVRQVVAALA